MPVQRAQFAHEAAPGTLVQLRGQRGGSGGEGGVVKQTVVELKPKEVIEFANEHGVPFALQQDVDAGGDLEKVATVARGSELLLKPKAPRWALESLDFELYEWQESLWRTLNDRSTPRRIVWCWGEPHSGKPPFITYSEQRLEDGVFSAVPARVKYRTLFFVQAAGCWNFRLSTRIRLAFQS